MPGSVPGIFFGGGMKKRGLKIHLNIGTVIFGSILIYLVITLLIYAFKANIDVYQVVSGPLSGNDTYTALILRNETVVKSLVDGYVNFYVSSASKVSKSELICSVTSESIPVTSVTLDSDDYSYLRSLASEASLKFDGIDFEDVYDLQYNISNILWDSSAIDSSNGSFYSSDLDGVVSTVIDGYEDMTEEELSSDLGQNTSNEKYRLKNQDEVEAGDDLYRIVSDEEWYIYISITDEQFIKLASLSSIKVKFLSDDNTETGNISYIEKDGQRYAKITFTSGMIRYVDERFVDVEIISNTQTGLKIPVSAVVTKEFYVIPEKFLTYSGDDSSEAGFLRETTDENGEKSTEFVSTTVYAMSDDDDSEVLYYVDMESFEDGEIIIATDSDSKYTIGATDTLEGVYSLNKGYAVFRRIVIIDQNSEYCIVEEGTDYGLSLYDFIALDGSSVTEYQIVY